jgi:hypothetical protein
MMSGMHAAFERSWNDFRAAKIGLIHALRTTKEDRLNWSPSPTARTPLQIGAHVAFAVGYMLGNAQGNTFAIPTPAEADKFFRQEELRLDTLENVLDELERNSKAYKAWLGTLSPEDADRVVDIPFGMGQFSVGAAIGFMPLHVMTHTAQIQYIQTIYGDHDWHMGA